MNYFTYNSTIFRNRIWKVIVTFSPEGLLEVLLQMMVGCGIPMTEQCMVTVRRTPTTWSWGLTLKAGLTGKLNIEHILCTWKKKGLLVKQRNIIIMYGHMNMLFIKYDLLTEMNYKIIDNLQTEMLDWGINSYITTNTRLECNLIWIKINVRR